MTLFCYGAIQMFNDENQVKQSLIKLSDALDWKLDFNALRQYSADRLFSYRQHENVKLLVYQIDSSEASKDTYDALYNDFGGETMLRHYREVAKTLGMSDWQTLEFGSAEIVTDKYRNFPAILPILTFLQELLVLYPNRLHLLCLNQDFEDASNLRVVKGASADLISEVWQTIAFGYTWPNLCLYMM